jgi:hypothetical protein
MKRILNCVRGILPRRLSVYRAAMPPRGLPSAWAFTRRSCVWRPVSEAERRNAKHSLALPCECPKCGRTKKWHNARATPWKPSKCANGGNELPKHETSCVFAASHRATFLCTSRRRRHRGLPSTCAWRPQFHAISRQLVCLTRRSWSKSILTHNL